MRVSRLREVAMHVFFAFTLCFLAVAPAVHAREATTRTHPPGAAIASAHRLATEAGMEALHAGGNAFDAAVAVSAVLSVVEPISSGLGGGGFFLLHDARTGRDVFIGAGRAHELVRRVVEQVHVRRGVAERVPEQSANRCDQ